MAPEWARAPKISPEERKRLAREKVARILAERQSKKIASENLQSPIAPGALSPTTPLLGVTLQRLQITPPPPPTDATNKRKRGTSPEGSTTDRRGSAPDSRRGSGQSLIESQSSDRVQPHWYTSITQRKLTTGGKNRNVDAKLEQIKHLIKACKERPSESEMQRLFDRIRDELHDLVFLQVSEIALRRKRMLHDDSGIAQLFDEGLTEIVFPWDIKADALELYNRWVLRVFSVDLLRGIIKRPSTGTSGNRSTGISGSRSSDRIDPSFPGKQKADFYGEGDLVNGQWWPTQLCTVRDGAHGSSQGGIYATKDKPAYSIILSGGNHYQDRDEGDELWYSGTDGKDGKVSENTKSLQLNITSSKPVRVIRSHNLAQNASIYRPPRGFRYDGLYDVLSYELVDTAKTACLFHLRRQPSQDPIRFSGKEMRPTAAEIGEYDKFRAEIEATERF